MAKTNTNDKYLLAILTVAFAVFIYMSLTGLTFSMVNIEGTEEVMIGEEVTYSVNLKAPDPRQYKTTTEYREQYGYWRLLNNDEELLFSGATTILSDGVYSTELTLIVPDDEPRIFLEAAIIEYRYLDFNGYGNFVKDKGTVIKVSSFEIMVDTCMVDTDCISDNVCQGAYGFCTVEKLCELKGVCTPCSNDDDCFINFVCSSDDICIQPVVEKHSLVDDVKQVFSTSITGEGEDSKEAPQILKMFVILIAVAVFFLYNKIKK